MDTLFTKIAGLDVHLKWIQVAVRCRQESGKLFAEVQSFGTMTRDLRALADYLEALGVTHVAMESTGVLWKPVWNVLEGRLTLLLVNPRHLKKVPGRKTDVKDAEWIAQLLQCGLLQGSFVPSRSLRNLRDLTRQRAPLTSEHTRGVNRIHKLLEDANIKLGAVASDVMGKSGRKMLRAFLQGRRNPEEIADLALRRLRAKIPQLQLALEGNFTEHHRAPAEPRRLSGKSAERFQQAHHAGLGSTVVSVGVRPFGPYSWDQSPDDGEHYCVCSVIWSNACKRSAMT
jgi:transposase